MASDTCVDRLSRETVAGMKSAERFFQFRVKGTSSNPSPRERRRRPDGVSRAKRALPGIRATWPPKLHTNPV